MCGDMTWKKRLIIAVGLMLLTHVAHAGRVEKFTDSQGTLHITNLGSPKPDNPLGQPSPGASSFPSRFRGNTPVPPPVRGVVPIPEVQVPQPEPQPVPQPEPQAVPEPETQPVPGPETQPEPEPGMLPTEPVPVEPQPGSRVIQPEGPIAVG